MRILACDPGGATGLAFYDTATDHFDSWQATGYDYTATQLCTWCRTPIDVIVVEGFKINAKTSKLDPVAFEQTLDLIGACRLLALQTGATFVRQYPQDKAFATNDKLRRLGWWSAGSAGHDNDAARHLLYYLARQQYAPILQRLLAEETTCSTN